MIFYGDSVVGKIRKVNEDSCVVKTIADECVLAVVADGMGGHRGGKKASSVALDFICEYVEKEFVLLKKKNEAKIRKLLEAAAYEANREILRISASDEDFHGMGTTVVVCLVLSDNYYVISAGDSRMYLCSDSLNQITKDHSYVRELVELGLITEQEAKSHPNKNIITRALGTDETIEFDFYTGVLGSDDIIMLCSDGLTNMVADDEILRILKNNRNPEDMVEKLLNNANNNGGTDNISVVVIKNNKKGGVER